MFEQSLELQPILRTCFCRFNGLLSQKEGLVKPDSACIVG